MRIRPAAASDYPAFARLYPTLHTDDPAPSRASWAEEIAPVSLVADDDGVIGYIYAQNMDGTLYVRHVAVDPSMRRRGVGRALMAAAADRSHKAGATRWCLNVRPENQAARQLYAAVGMRAVYSAVSVRLPWAMVSALPTAIAVRGLPIPPADDRMVEIATGLIRGQLALARRQPGRVLAQLRDGRGAVVGVAVFDPEFSAAFPFRVSEPSLAGALLTSLRPHARARGEWLNVVIEDDAPLAEALISAGATERMRFVHFDGALPRAARPRTLETAGG